MTINFFVLKGDLNGKIVVVCFFFCRVYLKTDVIRCQFSNINFLNIVLKKKPVLNFLQIILCSNSRYMLSKYPYLDI